MTDASSLDHTALYRVLAESAQDAILTMDENSIILSVNPAAEQLFMRPAKEMIGSSLSLLMPERLRARHRGGVARYLSTGVRHIPWQGVQIPVLAADGREIPVEISFGEFTSGGQRIFSGILRDMSDRLRAETLLASHMEQLQQQATELEQQVEEAQVVTEELAQANDDLNNANAALQATQQQLEQALAEQHAAADLLRRQEEEFRALANSIPTLAWMAQPDGWIFWYNQRWYEYTGTTPQEMEGWGWQRVHDPVALPKVMERWQGSLETRKPFEMTFPLRGADGSFRPFLTRVFPMLAADGTVLRWFGTNTDIQAEHQAREAAELAVTRTRQLQNVTALLARARTLQDVAAVILGEATTATGAATGMVAVRAAGTDEVVQLGASHLPAHLKADYERFPLSRDTPTAECIRTASPIFIGQRDGEAGMLARYPALRDVWESVGRSAVASIPLMVGELAIGAMTFTYAEPQGFSEEQREYLMVLGTQASQAIRRVEAFEAERRERQRSEAIVEAITDGFATFDASLRFTYVNARAAQMFGVERGDLVGREIDALPEASASPFVRLIRSVARDRRQAALEGYGTIMRRWLDLRAYPAEDGGVIAYFQDVTERRRQQEAAGFLAEASRVLASSPRYEETLTNLARVCVPRLGDWCAIDVLEPSENGAPVLRRVALVHEDATKVALAEEYRVRYPANLEDASASVTARALQGEAILLPNVTDESLAATLRDSEQLALLHRLGLASAMVVPLAIGDRVLGTLTLCASEAGTRYEDADLRLAQDVASRAATAVEHARLLERAESANAAKAEFLRNVSHELRQPLNAIGGLLQLWELGMRGELSPEFREDLGRIKRNQQQLATLIEDLLNYARLEAGKLVISRSRIPLNDVLEGLSAAVSIDLESKGVNYQRRPADPGLAVMADADRLHQVLVNLVTNAMRATAPGGHIEIWGEGVGERVRINVRDTGVGIPEDKLDLIFVPFVQVGRALNMPREGAGLGLAISRELMVAMGGTISVKSELGVGSTFTLTLERALP